MDEPIASKPSPDWMAGGNLLPWAWAVERLEAERNYWLVTTRRDGFPQARPVWGVWDDTAGLFLSVGHGGLQRTDGRAAMPITVHLDSALDVLIVEGVVDRIAPYPGAEPTFVVEPARRRAALERYNEKYDWDFDVDGDGLNFLVRPAVAYGWSSTPTAVEGGTKWTFPEAAASG